MTNKQSGTVGTERRRKTKANKKDLAKKSLKKVSLHSNRQSKGDKDVLGKKEKRIKPN